MNAAGHEAEHIVLDDLTRRAPGHGLMATCLVLQEAAPPRGLRARIVGGRPLSDDAWPWFVAVRGERAVARMLDALGPEYIVMHSVPVSERGADIDHVVVGPMGVVTITTKRHAEARVAVSGDAVLVAGRGQPYVDAARLESRRVRAILAERSLPAAPVRSLVVVVDAAQLSVREAPDDVDVIDARRLLRTIRRMPTRLEHEAAWTVAAALSSATTWTDANMADDSDVPHRFDRLEREVRTARAVRIAWAATGCAALSAAAVGAAMLMPALLGVPS